MFSMLLYGILVFPACCISVDYSIGVHSTFMFEHTVTKMVSQCHLYMTHSVAMTDQFTYALDTRGGSISHEDIYKHPIQYRAIDGGGKHRHK